MTRAAVLEFLTFAYLRWRAERRVISKQIRTITYSNGLITTETNTVERVGK